MVARDLEHDGCGQCRGTGTVTARHKGRTGESLVLCSCPAGRSLAARPIRWVTQYNTGDVTGGARG